MLLKGNGRIANTRHSINHKLQTDSLKINNDTGDASNYTLDGGLHEFMIGFNRKNHVKDRMNAFRKRGKRLFVKAPKPPRAAPAVVAVAAPRSAPSAPRAAPSSGPVNSGATSGSTSTGSSGGGTSSAASSGSSGGQSRGGDSNSASSSESSEEGSPQEEP